MKNGLNITLVNIFVYYEYIIETIKKVPNKEDFFCTLLYYAERNRAERGQSFSSSTGASTYLYYTKVYIRIQALDKSYRIDGTD